ncbi:MAG: cupin domain-containing protein [Clostridia bacterium]|nr:cupin domain-containing protein [Clostridia bacterium]MBO7170844.1 cupin domain-containing protein [Clostridia bacterium]
MHTKPIKPPPHDAGPAPAQIPLSALAQENRAFRRTLWTGEHLQLTVMCLSSGEDIGTEMHPDLDQLLRVEEGYALLRYGSCRSKIRDMGYLKRGDVFLVPAGTYHNLVNVGRSALRLSSVYAPPAHPHGTVHPTKEDALKAEK